MQRSKPRSASLPAATDIGRTSGACIALLDVGPRGPVSSNETFLAKQVAAVSCMVFPIKRIVTVTTTEKVFENLVDFELYQFEDDKSFWAIVGKILETDFVFFCLNYK